MQRSPAEAMAEAMLNPGAVGAEGYEQVDRVTSVEVWLGLGRIVVS